MVKALSSGTLQSKAEFIMTSKNLHAHPSKDVAGNTVAVILEIPENHLPGFKLILNRALNTWPDAPPEWKHLADMLEYGHSLQNYYHD